MPISWTLGKISLLILKGGDIDMEKIINCKFLRDGPRGKRCAASINMPSKMELETGDGFCTVSDKPQEQVACTEFEPSHESGPFDGGLAGGVASRCC